MCDMAPKQTETIKTAARAWLTKHQDESGGWAERPGSPVNILNTAEVMLAMFAAGADAGDPSIRGGAKYLLANGRDVPPEDRGAWGRNVQQGEAVQHIPDIVRTALALRALIKAGRQEEAAVKEAIGWLAGRQSAKREGYGWGYSRTGKSEMMPTCHALQALIEAYGAGAAAGLETPIRRGLEFLMEQRNAAAGCFGESGPMVGVHTIAAVLTLQAAGRYDLNDYSNAEKQAIQCVLANPAESRAVVEELATIDPDEEGNYGIVYMPKLLAARFQGLPADAVRELVMDFDENFDDATGGFYGRRIFSWSTAQALHALSASRLETLPEPEPVLLPQPERVSAAAKLGIALAFLVVLIAMIVLLAVKQVLNGYAAAVLLAIVLYAFLLTYGAIREGTFKDLVLATPRVFQGDGREGDSKRRKKPKEASK